jgi:hypothetical protein
MKFVTRTLRSLATKLHILAWQADIFGISQLKSYEIIEFENLMKFLKFLKLCYLDVN